MAEPVPGCFRLRQPSLRERCLTARSRSDRQRRVMHVRGSAFAAVALSVASYSISAQPGQSADPTAVLAAARSALGGDARLSAVKTFAATGRTRQVRGN